MTWKLSKSPLLPASRRAGRRTVAFVAGLTAALASDVVRGDDGTIVFSESERAKIRQHSPLEPPPPDPTNEYSENPAAARFGQFLFFDTRLSSNGKVSCATCHNPAHRFTDDNPIAEGVARGTRRTLPLWNVAHNRWFTWDGRADSLWAQAIQPLEDAREHGYSRLELAHLIDRDAELRRAYVAIFGPLADLSDFSHFPPVGGPYATETGRIAWESMRSADQATINRLLANVGKAIAAYERRIVSRNSRFDAFVRTLTPSASAPTATSAPSADNYPVAAKRGLKLFIGKANCRMCHSGPNFTDGEFHDIRVPPRAGGAPVDAGRHAGAARVNQDPFNAAGEFSAQRDGPAAAKLSTLAKNTDNWGQFKTPSLRNVAIAGPYMHQGQFATLRDVVRYYSTLEGALPIDRGHETLLTELNLTDLEIDDIVAFLETLTDTDLDRSLTRQPARPAPDSSR